MIEPEPGAARGQEPLGDGPSLTPAGSLRGAAITFNRPFRTRPVKDSIFYELTTRTDQADKWAEQNRTLEAMLRDPTTPPADRRRWEVNVRNNLTPQVVAAEERRTAWRRHRSGVEEAATPQ